MAVYFLIHAEIFMKVQSGEQKVNCIMVVEGNVQFTSSGGKFSAMQEIFVPVLWCNHKPEVQALLLGS